MAWSYRKNARHRNPKKDVQKAVCNKTKRKTKNEMAGWRVHGSEKDGNKWMERQSKGPRGLEAYCKAGQGPPWAVAPSKKNMYGNIKNTMESTDTIHKAYYYYYYYQHITLPSSSTYYPSTPLHPPLKYPAYQYGNQPVYKNSKDQANTCTQMSK